MTLQRSDFRFFHRLRVRWAEVDMQQIVFNAHYLMYLDTALGDYWRALALPYQEAMALLGGDLYVKKATLEYRASAHYDETLHIGLRCARVGTSSITFDGGIFSGNVLLVSAELVYVFAQPEPRLSRPIPEALRQVLHQFEAGQCVTRTAVGGWQTLADQITPLRRAVFVEEQGISAALVWDDQDMEAVHAVISNAVGQCIGCGVRGWVYRSCAHLLRWHASGATKKSCCTLSAVPKASISERDLHGVAPCSRRLA